MTDNQVCPHCRSDSLQKRGLTKTDEPKQQYACNQCGKWFLISLVEIDDGIEFLLSRSRIAELEGKDRFFVTCSQNNTPVDKGFWAAIGHYRKENGSELIIPTIRYKNPTCRFDLQDEDPDVWWPDEVLPYLCESIVKIHPEMWIMGNMRINATAVNPLTGLETLSQNASAI